MNKILLIIQREYLSRVKKKSFIIMTFLTPLLIAVVYALIGYFAYKGIEGTHEKVAVINHNKTLTDVLKTNKNTAYNYLDMELDEAKKILGNTDYNYILYLPEFPLDKPKGIELIGNNQAGLAVSERIAEDLETLIKNQKLKALGISPKDLAELKVKVNLATKNIGEGGVEQESNAGIATIIGSVAGVLMFMFIMIYGAQVMRGVIEEKTSRIIEVIISSVRPFQLMMGKIIGIALVGLTQFLLWIVLTFAISSVATQLLVDKQDVKRIASSQLQQKLPDGLDNSQMSVPTDDDSFAAIQQSLSGIEFGKLITVFLFFFLGGYLFYSALYAAIGSAVDNETETQQFMLPVMLPLLLGYALSLSVVNSNPHGSLSFWLSVIPFTSPIAMVVRMPYGVPDWQLALAAILLIVGFIGTVWLAGKIYRVGILMYGKKTNYKEIIKWLKYKN